MRIFRKLLFPTLLLLIVSLPIHAWQEKSSLEQILREEGIKPYKEPIHLQSKEWLIKEFGPGREYPINLSLATKNIVWQMREKILKGEEDPINGIIRTFWYTHIKSVFARADSLSEQTDQSDVLSKVLVHLVRERNIMRYKDMGFLDRNHGTQRIDNNWHVMLIGEKHGKCAVLDQIAKEIRCTVFTLGGQPSLLSMEFICDRYKEKNIDIRKSMYLIFVVDYDPSGWIIRDSVVRDLKFYGIKNIKPIDIVLPEILTPQELELAKIPLKESQQVQNEKWLAISGGINGELYGFESDSIPFERLRQKILEIATPYVGDPENIRRANTVKELASALRRVVEILTGLRTINQ